MLTLEELKSYRIVGHGRALRTQTRIRGGDVNPCLAFAAPLAAGSDAERFPHALREGISGLEPRKHVRQALGDEVVNHYLNDARTEQRLFDEAVTCYERERMFGRA